MSGACSRVLQRGHLGSRLALWGPMGRLSPACCDSVHYGAVRVGRSVALPGWNRVSALPSTGQAGCLVILHVDQLLGMCVNGSFRLYAAALCFPFFKNSSPALQ